MSILIAIYVKQTGILLTLAFDLLLACLVVPFILGLIWRKGTSTAALVSIVVGLAVRLVLFVMTPTMYGLDNTILYIPNGVFDATFDGWPTFIAFGASLVTYVAIALLTPPAPIRGLDIRVAEDVDDALDGGGHRRRGAGTPQGRGGATVAQRHGEHPVAHAAAGRLDRPAAFAEHVQHRAPPLPRPEHAVTGDAGPRVIGRG